MGKLYVVGDIHGDLNALNEVIARIDKDYTTDDLVVFVGDYVDRGNESKQVIDRLMILQDYFNCRFLVGNHDFEFLNNVKYFSRVNFSNYDNWYRDAKHEMFARIGFVSNYQIEAIKSFINTKRTNNELDDLQNNYRLFLNYEISDREILLSVIKLKYIMKEIEEYFKPQLNFLESLEGCIETDKYIISHSGGNKSKDIEDNSVVEWVWSREYRKSNKTDKTFIVGHTPTYSGRVDSNKVIKHIFVDTGAIFRGVPIGLYVSEYDYARRIK